VESYDVIIIGAGAAGFMCAITAGQRGRSVLLIDHSNKPAPKIRNPGGGRCNFTNRGCPPANHLVEKSALLHLDSQQLHPASIHAI